jgi:CDP-glycerol glycerophosphotransferase (TagB/SpsB family)
VVVVVEPGDDSRVEECLRSVRGQSRPVTEVLVAPVDPARSWQAAANDAAARARADLLWFVRGCDRLSPYAVEALAGPDSGSDLATGLLGQAGRPDPWLERAQRLAHADPDRGVDPRESPRLAGDLAISNHVFRTDRWRAGGREFDELDTWLESPAVAAALRAATRVDVVDRLVCTHAPDHGRRPFGAMPSPLPDLSAWVRRRGLLQQALAGTPMAEARRLSDADVGLPRFLVDAERATAEQWAQLVALAREILGSGLPPGTGPVGASLLWLAAEDRRAEAEELAVELDELDGDLRAHPQGEHLVADWRSVDVSEDVRRIPTAENPLLADVRRVRPEGADLFLRIPHLDLATVDHEISAELPDGTPVDVTPQPDATANRWAADRFASAAEGACRVALPAPGDVRVRLSAGDLHREATVEVGAPARRDDPGAVVLHDVRLEDDALVVTGDGDLSGLRLAGPRTDLPARLDGGGSARIPLVRDRFGREVGLATAPYRLTAPGGVGCAAGLRQRLPLELPGDRHRVQVTRPDGGEPVLLVGPPFADHEIGPWAQQRLREEYAAWAGGELPVTAGLFYFESFAGGSATDSPLAICAELRRRRPDATVLWGVVGSGETVPDGVTPLLVRSREWYRTLATAELLVTSTELEEWFVSRPDQLVVQTFHGYPSKAMGAMQWRAWQLPPRRIRAMRRRGVDTWDLILTPTPEMTRHYREQYDYAGPAAEHGYPRDDALTAPDADRRRAETRSLLGIRADQTAILYAPTFRDDLATRPRRAGMPDHLDVPAAAAALGDGHVLLLRGHRFHTPAGHETAPGAARVVDVTDHPEINDLILASDAAVLDYSSLRFDFAITGRPMVFLVPDLDDYAGGVRGFLFPFAESTPGPLVRETEEVVDQVRDVAALAERWSADLAAFNATYNPWQDGHAAGRVADQILDLLGGGD